MRRRLGATHDESSPAKKAVEGSRFDFTSWLFFTRCPFISPPIKSGAQRGGLALPPICVDMGDMRPRIARRPMLAMPTGRLKHVIDASILTFIVDELSRRLESSLYSRVKFTIEVYSLSLSLIFRLRSRACLYTLFSRHRYLSSVFKCATLAFSGDR